MKSYSEIKIPVFLLKILSVIYLGIPVLVLLLGWVRPLYSLPVSAMFLIALFKYIQYNFHGNTEYYTLKTWQFLGVIILGTLWVSLSGIGGFGMLIHDHQKIYALTKDIIQRPWPVTYLYQGQHYYLAAYIGYHIVSPVLAGWISYNAATIFLFCFSSFGVLLGVFWFIILSKSKGLMALLFFMLIGGLDIAGYFLQNGIGFSIREIMSGDFPQIFWSNSLDIDRFLIYHGNTNLLFWAAPHAVPCWVLSGLFFYELIVEKNIYNSPIYLFAMVFWSPFMLVGIFPYFIWYLFKNSLVPFFSLPNFFIIPAFVILFLFVNAVSVNEIDKGFIFSPLQNSTVFVKDFLKLAWFEFFEVGIWFMATWFLIRKEFWKESKTFLTIILIILICIPFYRLGKYNDWVQRVSMPSLFLLWSYLFRCYSFTKNTFSKLLFILIFSICSLDSVFHLYVSYKHNGLTFDHHPMKFEEVQPMPETSVNNGWPIEQILATGEPFFFKYLAKKHSKKTVDPALDKLRLEEKIDH